MNTSQKSLSSLRCAVFGAGGFIGTNLCKKLQAKVDVCYGIGRRRIFLSEDDTFKWISGDFQDKVLVSSILKECDTVFHLVNSSTPASGNLDKASDLKSNVLSTIHFLEACRKHKVKRIVFISSGGTIYGLPNEIPTPESASTNPITSYGICKLTIEKYLNLYEHLYGIKSIILRVSNPFGPYQIAHKRQGVIAAFMQKTLENKPVEIWGDGTIIRDYIFIDDVIDSMILAATYEGNNKIFNIGSGYGKSILEIIECIQEVSNSKTQIIYREGRNVDIPKSILDINRAQTELLWNPVHEFKSGMMKTYEWMKKYNF